MFTLPFWRAALERAVRTAAQTAAGLVAADQFDLLQADWAAFGAVVGSATLLSLLMSLAAEQANPATGPSFGTEKPAAGKHVAKPNAPYTGGM